MNNRHDPKTKLAGAWVDRELVDMLIRNGVNISEVIRKALKAEAKKLGLVIVTLLLSACAGPLDPVTPAGRFFTDYWRDLVTNDSIDAMEVNPGSFSTLKFRFTTGSFLTECSLDFHALGDSRSGQMLLGTNPIIRVQPIGQDATKCEFMKTLSHYQVVGQSLVLTFDGGAQTKTFSWNGATY